MLGEVSDNSADTPNVAASGPQRQPELHDRPESRGWIRRDRRMYAIAIGVVMLAGLASRSSLIEGLPSLIGAYAGDTLWALALFLAVGFVLPCARVTTVALLTIAISFGVELSQLYQADWINAIRHTRIGGLILGFDFKGSDLLCYTVGCLLGIAAEILAQGIGKNRANSKGAMLS